VKDATPDPFHASGRSAQTVVILMGQNRIQEFVRDPTLESPSLDYFEVRMPWVTFAVTRASAERIVAAMTGFELTPWVRAETVSGSVIWVRTEAVVYVREWTGAQRASEDSFWKQIEAEGMEQDEPSKEDDGGDAGGPDGAGDLVEGAGEVSDEEDEDSEPPVETQPAADLESTSPILWAVLFAVYLVGRFVFHLLLS
jgi:hypothetical protein